MTAKATDTRHTDHIGADGVFRTMAANVTMKGSERLHIIPIGDIHHDAPSHCADTWRSTLARIKELDAAGTPYRLLGMGDYMDFASTSERAKLSRQGELHESTHATLDRQADSALLKLKDQLWFTRGKWLGFIQGNHYWRYLTGGDTGKTTSMMLAESLGGEWLGWAAYIILNVVASGCRNRVDIFASHGKGGGQLLGTPYNNVHKMRSVFPAADVYLMGHDHNRGAIPKPVLTCRNHGKSARPVVHAQRQIFGRTGSFLKAYEPSVPNYVVQALMHPSDLGHIELVVKSTKTRKTSETGRSSVIEITTIA